MSPNHRYINRRLTHHNIRHKATIFLLLLYSFSIVALFAILLHFSFSILNPDWLSYQYIYETKGAWLSEQGRDPAFVTLTTFLADLFGPNGYEEYRISIAAYFLVFIALLSGGFIFTRSYTSVSYSLLSMAFIYLGLIRFTIQIREGLALTIVILSLAILFKLHSSQSTKIRRYFYKFCALSLMLLAGLIHVGTSLFFLILIAAFWSSRKRKIIGGSQLPASPQRLRLLWIGAIAIAIASVVQLYNGGSLESIALDTFGDRVVEVKPLSLLQVGLWTLYGVVCWVIYRETISSIRQRQIDGGFATYLYILNGPIIVAVYLSIVIALFLAISPLYISSYVRVLHMCMSVALICLAVVTARRKLAISSAGLFLILDQVRSVHDAISNVSI